MSSDADSVSSASSSDSEKSAAVSIIDIASKVAQKGSEYEKKLKYRRGYGFLHRRNENHSLYLEWLAKHRDNPHDPDTVTIPAPFMEPGYHDTIKLQVSVTIPPLPPPFPEEITAKEYHTMKLTALFAARYEYTAGYQYSFMDLLEKRNDPQFDFAFFEKSTTEEKFLVFEWLRESFRRVVLPLVKNNMPSIEPVVEDLIKLVQGEGPFVSGIDYIAGVRLPTERPPPRRKDKKKWWNRGPVDSQFREWIDSTASAIACLGSWLEMKIKEDNGSNPQFSFLLSTDANHAFYKDKLAKYRLRKGLFKAPKPFLQARSCDDMPDLAPCPFPEGITVKEYDTITLTAQFAVRYRTWFLQELKKRNDPQFDFVESRSGYKFIVFCWLCGFYSRVMMPCNKESMPCMESTVEAFIQFLQGEKREAAFKSFFDYSADIRMLPPPGHLSVMMNPSTHKQLSKTRNVFYL